MSDLRPGPSAGRDDVPSIAVTGAAGHVGGKVVDLLVRSARVDVIAVTRRAVSVARGVRNAIAAYEDPRALRKAFGGVDTLVLVTSDGDVASVMEHHCNIVRAAHEASIRRVVCLGGIDADARSPFCYSKANASLERSLAERHFELAFVRASIFAELFAPWLDVAARRGGALRVPAADAKVSLVARDDVATALAQLALGSRDGTYHITGPRALDCTAMARIASRCLNSPVTYTDLDPRSYLVEMAGADLDPWWMYAFASLFESIRERRWEAVSNDFERLIGRPSAALESVLGAVARDPL